MCARGIKNEPYEEESKSLDIEQFRDRLKSVASSTQDPRCKDNLKYNLFTLLAIIFCAVIADANSISAIHQYAVSKKKWLMTWLDFDEVPSYNTFWWLLVRLDPKETEMLFRKWTFSISKNEIDDFITIDGKRVRGASNKKKTPKSLLHMVSAWSSHRGLILGQIKTDVNSNEITAIPKLLESIDLKGATVSIDAMGCQKEIAKKIIDQGADYVLMVKDNQHKLYEELENYFKQARDIEFEGVPHDFSVSEDNKHGRQERREIYVTGDVDWLPMKEEWLGLRSLSMLISYRTLDGRTTEEIRYYISSLSAAAEKISKSTRGHWGIENQVHWILDVTFQEDASQISTGYAAENFSILRRLSLNVLRLDPDKKSLKGKRQSAGWNNQYMEYLLGLAATKKF